MESDTNAPVSDEQRRLAETKKLTMQPIHVDVKPDAQPDSEIVAHHLSQPAIGNMPNDTEQTAPLVQPSKGLLEKQLSSPKRSKMAIILVLAATTAIVLIAVLTVVILVF